MMRAWGSRSGFGRNPIRTLPARINTTTDNLNRLNFVGRAVGTQGNTYASTISYQYDAGNRMTQATDSDEVLARR